MTLATSCPCAVSGQLGLEAVDKALRSGVVQRVTDGASRGQHAVIVERRRVVEAGVLTAGVPVMNERDVGVRCSLMQSRPQHVENERAPSLC